MHRFSTYKNSSNPQERIFALNIVTLETVVTFNNKQHNNNKGNVLSGWFKCIITSISM